MKLPSPVKVPLWVWIIFDPRGVAERVYLNKPPESEMAWCVPTELTHEQRSHRTLPYDIKIAKELGYRLLRVSLRSDPINEY